VLCGGDGARDGDRFRYDPFGQPIAADGSIGTAVADDTVPDTLPGDADYAWVGSNSKLYEHQGSIATIEMGARQYVAALGRFLEVDPVEGGVTNNYDYPSDPINGFDLSGECSYYLENSGCSYTWGQNNESSRRISAGLRGSAAAAKTGTAKKVSSPKGSDWVIAQCSYGPCGGPPRQKHPKSDLSLEIGGEGCGLVCLNGGVLVNEDGFHPFWGPTGGPEAGFSVHVGVATRKSSGLAWGGTCTPAPGVGIYGEGGVGYGDNGVDPYGGFGLAFGAEAGCSYGASWMY
jgi:RHS repeat-associated protein